MSTFKTDAPVRGSLNVGLLPSAGSSGASRPRGGAEAGVGGGQGRTHEGEASSDDYLDRFEEELHKKVDSEIEVLVSGLEECVALAKVRLKA